MKCVYLSLLVFTLSCSQDKDIFNRKPSSVRDVDPELEKYVTEFELLFNIKIDYPVKFSNIVNAVGQCVKYDDGTKEIKIDRKFFDNVLDEQREQMIGHEIGHCQFNKSHRNGIKSFENILGDYPDSIMNPSVFNELQIKAYILNRDYYINELKN